MSSLSEREFYGYELVEHVDECGAMKISDGTLYAILARLKDEGLVRSRLEQGENGPVRKYYSLTRKGEHALAGMRREWMAIIESVSGVARKGPP